MLLFIQGSIYSCWLQMADLEKGQFLVSPTQQSIARDDVTSSVKSTPIGGKNGIPLYHYHDLPLFLRGNPYITSGYRAYLPTDMCIKRYVCITYNMCCMMCKGHCVYIQTPG